MIQMCCFRQSLFQFILLGISDLISYTFSDKQQAFGQAQVKNSGFVVFHLEVLLHIITEDNLRVSGTSIPHSM
jgi:hypothetical protein